MSLISKFDKIGGPKLWFRNRGTKTVIKPNLNVQRLKNIDLKLRDRS
jgi:hypothetical protein